MKPVNNIISETRLRRLRAQGYTCEGDQKLSDMAFGIRFAYRACVIIILIAMVGQSIPLFSVMSGIAFLGVVLPNHPFDYVYNHTLSKWMNAPKLPARSRQLKFACTMATVWLVLVVYLLSAGFVTAALILAGLLAVTAMLPSTIDLCVPSLIYNTLVQKKVSKIEATIS